MATAKQRAAKRPSKKTGKKKTTNRVASSKVPLISSEAANDKVINSAATSRLPGVWAISRMAILTLRSQWRLFLGIGLIYLVLNIVLVEGLSVGSSIDISGLKNVLSGNFSGGLAGLWTGFTVFTVLVVANTSTATTTGNDTAPIYQVLLIITISLALIWALRQVMAGTPRVRIRDSFYKGMYPVIPVLLVLIVLMAELLPFIFSGYIYGLVISSGVAVHLVERIIWAIVLIIGLAISGYLLSSSIFAVYIAALPDMTPIRALRSARDLVKHRRWAVLRRLVALPLILFLVGALIITPIVLIATAATPWVFFGLTILGLVAVHAYMYTLYRELLG